MPIFNRIDQIRSILKFQYKYEQDIYDELIELYQTAYQKTNKVIYLIEICRVEKMMFSRTTNKAKTISKQAFINHPSEKTMYFYLATHVVNGNFDSCKKNLEDAFLNIKNKNLLAIKKLYDGCLQGLIGNYYQYNKLISEAKDDYEGSLYWQLDSIVTEYDDGKDDILFLEKKIELDLSISKLGDIEYIFSLSADYIYLKNYFEYFYESFVKTNPKGIIHLSLVNCSNKKDEVIAFLSEKKSVVVSFFDFSDKYDHRPLSAVLRLLVIELLLKKFNKPVFFGEIDGLVLSDLNEVIMDLEATSCDQLVRVIGSYLPWQRYTCGFGLYLTTPESIKAAELLMKYIKRIFNTTNKHWWMDQVALEASIRFSLLLNYKYQYFEPKMDYINRFVFTPVGADAHEKKLYHLQSKLSEILCKS